MEEKKGLPAESGTETAERDACASAGATGAGSFAPDDRLRADAMHAEAMRARDRRLAVQGGVEVKQQKKQGRVRRSEKPAKPENPRGEEPREGRRRGHGRDRFVKRLVWMAIVLVLLIALVLLILPRIDKAVEALTPEVSITVPDSLQDMLPDETMGYTAIDFTNAILGESRERKELVVMEQDVEVTSKISQDLLRLSLFSKVKIIRSHGTGVYTVALDEIAGDDIAVNNETKIITVTIPHTELSYVNVDVEKTEFEDTQKALFAIGDIKLTTEQKHMLDQSVDDTLHERLNDKALFAKADEIALNKVREILQPIVGSISDEYIVKIVMPQGE